MSFLIMDSEESLEEHIRRQESLVKAKRYLLAKLNSHQVNHKQKIEIIHTMNTLSTFFFNEIKHLHGGGHYFCKNKNETLILREGVTIHRHMNSHLADLAKGIQGYYDPLKYNHFIRCLKDLQPYERGNDEIINLVEFIIPLFKERIFFA